MNDHVVQVFWRESRIVRYIDECGGLVDSLSKAGSFSAEEGRRVERAMETCPWNRPGVCVVRTVERLGACSCRYAASRY